MNLYKVLTTNGRTLYYIVPNIDAKLVYNKVKLDVEEFIYSVERLGTIED